MRLILILEGNLSLTLGNMGDGLRRVLMCLLLSEASSMISENSKLPSHWNGCQGAGSGGGLNVLDAQNLSAVWRRVGHLL